MQTLQVNRLISNIILSLKYEDLTVTINMFC